MKYLIILICIAIIILGIYILIKTIRNYLKGKGCQSCGCCSKKSNCKQSKMEACNEEGNTDIGGKLS